MWKHKPKFHIAMISFIGCRTSEISLATSKAFSVFLYTHHIPHQTKNNLNKRVLAGQWYRIWNEYQEKSECPSQVMKQIVGKKRWVINIFTRPKTDTTSQPSTSILLQLIPLFENERWKGSPPSIHGWWFVLFGYESSQTYPCALTGYNSLWGTSLRRSRKYISKRIIKFPQVFN